MAKSVEMIVHFIAKFLKTSHEKRTPKYNKISTSEHNIGTQSGTQTNPLLLSVYSTVNSRQLIISFDKPHNLEHGLNFYENKEAN